MYSVHLGNGESGSARTGFTQGVCATLISVSMPAFGSRRAVTRWLHRIVSAHFGEDCEHLLHGEMGFIAQADHEQIVDNPILLPEEL